MSERPAFTSNKPEPYDDDGPSPMLQKHRVESLRDVLARIDAEELPPEKTQLAQVTFGLLNGVQERLDSLSNPETRGAAWGNLAAGMTFSMILAAGLTRLSVVNPALARKIGTGGKLLMAADLAERVGEAGAAGYDTWRDPTHYKTNAENISHVLGNALFDYSVMAPAGLVGFGIGKTMFQTAHMGPGLSQISVRYKIPELKHSEFLGRARGVEGEATGPAAEAFTTLKDRGLRINGGSGVVIDGENGLFATNYHVVRGKSKLFATAENGEKFDLELVARNKDADLALVRSTKKPTTALPAVERAETFNVEPGDTVYTVGHPAGSYKPVLSQGKYVGLADSRNFTARSFDMPIMGGNSGSPVYNFEHKMVAMNSSVKLGTERAYSTSIEHLNEMIAGVQTHNPVNGWLEFKSTPALPDVFNSGTVRIGSTFEFRDRLTLAQWAKARWKKPPSEYGSHVMGAGRLALPTAYIDSRDIIFGRQYSGEH